MSGNQEILIRDIFDNPDKILWYGYYSSENLLLIDYSNEPFSKKIQIRIPCELLGPKSVVKILEELQYIFDERCKAFDKNYDEE